MAAEGRLQADPAGAPAGDSNMPAKQKMTAKTTAASGTLKFAKGTCYFSTYASLGCYAEGLINQAGGESLVSRRWTQKRELPRNASDETASELERTLAVSELKEAHEVCQDEGETEEAVKDTAALAAKNRAA